MEPDTRLAVVERALGHVRTIAAHAARMRAPVAVRGVPWRGEVADERRGTIALSGTLHRGDSDLAIVIVHGLGGSADSGYVRQLAAVAVGRGASVLRLNLRGADRSGADIYHAGLAADLRAALVSDALAEYRHLAVIGFSLGGHVTLRLAADLGQHPIERLRAVAALCAPLDLEASCADIDRRRSFAYRQHLLRGLRDIYRAMARRDPSAHLSDAELARITSIRTWDERVVAPRFGFAGAADYYQQMSVGPHLGRIAVPTLILHSAADPMVKLRSVARHAARAAPPVQVRLLPGGGHVAFSDRDPVWTTTLGWIAAQAHE